MIKRKKVFFEKLRKNNNTNKKTIVILNNNNHDKFRLTGNRFRRPLYQPFNENWSILPYLKCPSHRQTMRPRLVCQYVTLGFSQWCGCSTHGQHRWRPVSLSAQVSQIASMSDVRIVSISGMREGSVDQLEHPTLSICKQCYMLCMVAWQHENWFISYEELSKFGPTV